MNITIKEIPILEGSVRMQEGIPEYNDVDSDHTYLEFYKDNVYQGMISYKEVGEGGEYHRSWHTYFVKPARKILKYWQETLGGVWVAYVLVGNDKAYKALIRGGMEDYGIHTNNNHQEFYILIIDHGQPKHSPIHIEAL